MDRFLDRPGLLRWVARFATRTPYSSLGGLTISMLEGDHGLQRKELAKLVTFLREEVRPEVILLTNVLLSGIVPTLRKELGVPVWATLQGDDIFLQELPDRDRQECFRLIRANCDHVSGLIATSDYYANHMRSYLDLPSTPPIQVVYPGLQLKGHGPNPTPAARPRIGFFARMAPEKGFHNLVDAFIALRQSGTDAVLRASGWRGPQHAAYIAAQEDKLRAANLLADFEYGDSPDHAAKVRFLNSIDLLSVPTTYREPKGLYVLEAWANGVPVVLPSHGTFPELVAATGGGWLVEPNSIPALTAGLREAVASPTERHERGQRGLHTVRDRFQASHMAAETLRVLQQLV
jgi:glycosyltransferase involved in cell wall biosynthesis